MSASRAREAALVAAGFTLVLALLLAGTELLLRALPAETLGFAFVNGQFQPPIEFELDFAQNELGYHDAEIEPKTAGVRRVVVLGDSMVQGAHVEVPQTVGQRLEHHLEARSGERWDVVAMATPGGWLETELNMLRLHGERLDPDWVVTVFSQTDAAESSPELQQLHKRQQREVKAGRSPLPGWFGAEDVRFLWLPSSVLNQLVAHRLALARATARQNQIPVRVLLYAAPPDERLRRAFEHVADALGRTRDRAHALGARYALASAPMPWGTDGEAGLERLVSTYPSMRERKWDLDQPDGLLAEVCERLGVPFLPLQPVFRERTLAGGDPLHWRYDAHWTPAGHDLAGALLAAFLLELEEDR